MSSMMGIENSAACYNIVTRKKPHKNRWNGLVISPQIFKKVYYTYIDKLNCQTLSCSNHIEKALPVLPEFSNFPVHFSNLSFSKKLKI